jgi:hypothetical protein
MVVSKIWRLWQGPKEVARCAGGSWQGLEEAESDAASYHVAAY